MNDKWKTLKRIIVLLGGLWIAYASGGFSVEGFSGASGERGVAVGMACVVFILQLVFNDQDILSNPTMFIAGLASYIFSMSTNVQGIAAWRGGPWYDVINLSGGIIMDWVPEPMIVYGLLGRLNSGDLIKNVVNMLGGIFGFVASKVDPLEYGDASKPRKNSGGGGSRKQTSTPSTTANPERTASYRRDASNQDWRNPNG